MNPLERFKHQHHRVQQDINDIDLGKYEVSQSKYDSLIFEEQSYHLATYVLNENPAACSLHLSEFIKAIDLHGKLKQYFGGCNRSYRGSVALNALEIIKLYDLA